MSTLLIIAAFLHPFFPIGNQSIEPTDALPTAGDINLVHLAGQIDDYDSGGEERIEYVRIREIDLVTGERNLIEADVQADGSFELVFPIPFTQDIQVDLGETNYAFLVRPGDSLVINFRSGRQKETIKLEGRYDPMNQWINAYRTRMKKANLEGLKQRAEQLQQTSTADFIAACRKAEKQLDDLTRQFIAQHNLEGSATEAWCARHWRYSLGGIWLERYTYSAIFREPIADSATYFNYAETFTLYDDTAHQNSAYLQFLNTYANLKPQLTEQLRSLSRDSMVKVLDDRLIRYITEAHTGFPREVMLTQYLLSCSRSERRMHLVEQHRSLFDSLVVSTFLREPFLRMYQQQMDADLPATVLPATVMEMTSPYGGEAIVPYLRKQVPGKWLLVEVWATWCEPCLDRLGRYSQLSDNSLPENVDLVFLSLESPHNQWRSILAEIQPPGRHLWLDAMQHHDVTEQLGIKRIPSRFFVTPEGQITQTTPPTPIAELLDRVGE